MAQKKTPPPIDRPLSKAYLRGFKGWSTAYPPGLSEPNALRRMENVRVDRNGAVEVRPGLKTLAYSQVPGLDLSVKDHPGYPEQISVIGGPEVLYLDDGTRALLVAEKISTDDDSEVRFTVIPLDERGAMTLTEAGFQVPEPGLTGFTAAVRHVEFLQIDNRIIALPDNGEPPIMLFAGLRKAAVRPRALKQPAWAEDDKLVVRHPETAWIGDHGWTTSRNEMTNPSFGVGMLGWGIEGGVGVVEDGRLRVTVAPEAVNLHPRPLHDVASTDVDGWFTDGKLTTTVERLGPSGQHMAVTTFGEGGYAVGPRAFTGVRGGQRYELHVDVDQALMDTPMTPLARAEYFTFDGSLLLSREYELGAFPGTTRASLDLGRAPLDTTSIRISLGARPNDPDFGAAINFANVLLCPYGQGPTMVHGDIDALHHWLEDGTTQKYPAINQITVLSPPVTVEQSHYVAGSIRVEAQDSVTPIEIGLELLYYDSTGEYVGQGIAPPVAAFLSNADPAETLSMSHSSPPSWSGFVPGRTDVRIAVTINDLEFGLTQPDGILIDQAMMQTDPSAQVTLDPYFDGSSDNSISVAHRWEDAAHLSPSIKVDVTGGVIGQPSAESPTASTLVKNGGDSANPYRMGFWYTFNTLWGESAPSMVTEIRIQRPWDQWKWETADANGAPSGTPTTDPSLCADQLFVGIPLRVYNDAAEEGAISWNLYAMSWSDQDPVPVEGRRIATTPIRQDPGTASLETFAPFRVGAQYTVTPLQNITADTMLLPTKTTRENFSTLPDHFTGAVAGDRVILVGSATRPADIDWTSNRPGAFTDFSSVRGGGRKTLSSGNLNLPWAVVLWQNPQSIDTLTVLCADDNAGSTAYYMAPFETQSTNGGTLYGMGFEETTSTPGTTSPWAALVANNALYRPLDSSFMKSTANNYNINHKPQTDEISDMWQQLQDKHLIVAAALDNRIHLLVHNPDGAVLEPRALGNEIWVLDLQAESGGWSRYLIQGCTLQPVAQGSRRYMAIGGPTGLRYLHDDKVMDEHAELVSIGGDPEEFLWSVVERPIPWMFETNTQGANRAHDAWAHLRQITITLGNFQGKMRYGIRGVSLNGRTVDVRKDVEDLDGAGDLHWQTYDHLQVRRDLMEWTFRAESLPGVFSHGLVGAVQYRYTPVSVNVGYEHGSVETFVYGADPAGYTRNAVPLPLLTDYER